MAATLDDRHRVLVDARLESGKHGGVEQVIIGLVHGLSTVKGDEEFACLCYEGETDWIEPYVTGACRIVTTTRPLRGRIARTLPWLAAVRRRVDTALTPGARNSPVPLSDGTAERLGAAVVHFPRQDGFLTSIPSIFHPHDLQHVHFPEFFADAERCHRDLWYKTLADQAALVSVTSRWGKRDLMEHLGIPPEKIAVVPLAPALAAYGEPMDEVAQAATLARFGVSRPFALYPAQTWPHKNHVRLVRAVRLARERGSDVTLVCTGALNDGYPEVRRAVVEAGLEGCVTFLGYVTAAELQALYASARCLVMPTLFEAAGGFGPVAEAFLSGVPVACSHVTSLPEQVGDAALLFDPDDEASIALALRELWTDEGLRAELVRRGRENIGRFSWERVALTFRAHYRRLAGWPLAASDVELLHDAAEF